MKIFPVEFNSCIKIEKFQSFKMSFTINIIALNQWTTIEIEGHRKEEGFLDWSWYIYIYICTYSFIKTINYMQCPAWLWCAWTAKANWVVPTAHNCYTCMFVLGWPFIGHPIPWSCSPLMHVSPCCIQNLSAPFFPYILREIRACKNRVGLNLY